MPEVVKEVKDISIHAPREGRDVNAALRNKAMELFQSTRPARGATIFAHAGEVDDLFQSTRPARGATGDSIYVLGGEGISIHAPREGRD